jgi:AcrR family transcriptional regulator
METQQNEIIEKAAEIIMNSGVEELTVHNLADKLQIKESQLYRRLTKDDDILLILLLSFESDIMDFLKGVEQSKDTPENELKILFKKLYFLFLQKPYYLDLIFDKKLKDRDESIKNSFLRIREMAENLLTDIINKGKSENTFKTNVSTRVLVNKILSGFRTYMKDEQRLHEVIIEMKKLKTSKD